MPQPPEHDIEAAPQRPVQDENAPADGYKRLTSDRYEGQTYEQRLYRYVNRIKGFQASTNYLEFRDLAQMNIIHLMNELAKYDQAMRKDEAAPQDIENVETLLHRYSKCVYLAMVIAFPLIHRMSATAVQDLGYWSRLPKRGHRLGEMIYNELRQTFPGVYGDQGSLKMAHLDKALKPTPAPVDPLRKFLRRVLPKNLTWANDERTHRPAIEYILGEIPTDISPFVDTLARFIVAITGGLALVVPMLVMRLGETLPKSLTTVSVAVVLFSALTSLMFKASNVETLGATAAYAAVLVVFVGTSS